MSRPPYHQAQSGSKGYPEFTGLTRTPSEYAQLSLARMASLETYHVHDSHNEESEDPHGLSDIRSNRSRPQDLESGPSIHLVSGPLANKPLNVPTNTPQPSRQDPTEDLDAVDQSCLTVTKSKNDVYDDRKGEDGSEGDLAAPVGDSSADSATSPSDASRELQDQTNLLPVRQVVFVFLGLSCALFVSLLDQTIVSTALPTLGRVFSRAEIASWVATAYLLTSTAVQPIYSRLSDVFGRKIMLVISLVIFSIGSLACALSQSMIQLIVFRAIAGLGGGGILTLVMIVVSDVVSLKERGKYQGILGGVVATANSVGPVLGGVFTEKASWRWCFWINLPMTALALMVVFFALPLKPVKGDIWAKFKKIDYYGCLLTLAFSVLILMALSWGGTQYAWDSAGVLAPLIIGIALLGVFIFVEWKIVPLPLIPMHIFRDATVSGAMIATFLSGMVFYAQLFFLPQYFQVVRGDSAIRSGILLLPLIVVQTVTSFTAGVIVSKTGDYRVNLYLGFAIWTIGTGLLTTIGPTTSTAKICGYQVLSGIGGGQTFQTSLVAIQATVARQEMAVATGARNFIRMLGGSVALAACASLLNNAVSNELYKDAAFPNDLVRQIVSDPTQINDLLLTAVQKDIALRGYTRGIRNVFYLLLPCCAISFFVVVFFVKAHSLKRDDDATLKKEGKDWVARRKEKGRQGADAVVQPTVVATESTGPSSEQRT